MATTATIPVTLTPHAAARIADLNLQAEFERMVEHTRQTAPGLRSISVTLGFDPCPEVDPGIVLWAHRDHPGPGYDPTNWNWGAWEVATFPPEVSVHFTMISTVADANDGR